MLFFKDHIHPADIKYGVPTGGTWDVSLCNSSRGGENAMKARIKPGLFLLFLGLFISFPCNGFSQEYKIAILANRGLSQAQNEWKATAEYLSSKLGMSFSVAPMDDATLRKSVEDGKVDFFYTNPAMYVELNRLNNARAVVTLVNRFKDQPLEQWGSAIFVKKGSPIKTLEDFKGKDFLCRGLSTFGGWLMAKRVFLENGIVPEKDFKSLRSISTHDNVVYAVLNGVADGGCVRTGTLEKMAWDGKIHLEDFRIIHQTQDGHPFLHSTVLYPEYPMAACSHVPSSLSDKVAEALMAMTPNDPAAISAKISGWKKPASYDAVIECLAMVQYGPFATASSASVESPDSQVVAKGARRRSR